MLFEDFDFNLLAIARAFGLLVVFGPTIRIKTRIRG